MSAARRLAWGDPPPPSRTDWADVARKLRDRPGDWARVGVYARTVASHVRSGRISALRPVGHWEARTDPTDQPGRAVLWLRYVGPIHPEGSSATEPAPTES